MTDETQATETKTPKAPKEPKPDKVYYLGPKATPSSTVFGQIRSIIAKHQDVDGKVGVSASKIREEMLANFSPKKSGNYGEKYVNSYVRDLEKYGFATTDASQAVKELAEPPVKEKKESTKAPKGPKVTETGEKILGVMKSSIDENAFKSNSSTLQVTDVATSLTMKAMVIAKSVESLVKNGFVDLRNEGEGDEQKVYVNFTQQGWDHVNKAA
jgi:hypothetical protein